MKRSEVIKELLDSYYFQHGRSANNTVIKKANKIIKAFEKAEALETIKS